MPDYTAYRYSVTIYTEDLAVVHCLRGLAQYTQASGSRQTAWENTGEREWRAANCMVTFHFTEPSYRDDFLESARRILQTNTWNEASQSDHDPAQPSRR